MKKSFDLAIRIVILLFVAVGIVGISYLASNRSRPIAAIPNEKSGNESSKSSLYSETSSLFDNTTAASEQPPTSADYLYSVVFRTISETIREGTTFTMEDDGAVIFHMPIEGEATYENVNDAFQAIIDFAPVLKAYDLYKVEKNKLVFRIEDESGTSIIDQPIDCSGIKPVASTAIINPDYVEIVEQIVG